MAIDPPIQGPPRVVEPGVGGSVRVVHAGVDDVGRGTPDPRRRTWRRGAKMAAAIEAWLQSKSPIDPEQLLHYGAELKRFLEPFRIQNPVQNSWPIDRQGFFLGWQATIAATTLQTFQLDANLEQCALVRARANGILQAGSVNQSLRFRAYTISRTGSYAALVAGSEAVTTLFTGPSFDSGYLWIPPGQGIVVEAVIQGTGPSVDIDAGLTVYGFPAGMFPECC